MKSNLVMVSILFVASHSVAQTGTVPVSLFNGKNLQGWTGYGGAASANWVAEGGVLCCTGAAGASWIHIKKEYGDFELSLEFNLPPNANSGVFIRAPKTGDPWVSGMEIQLLDDEGKKWKNLQPDQYSGSIYAVMAPSRRVTRQAGKWQSLKIRCVGKSCQVWLNGQQVVDADLKALALKAGEKVPGLRRARGLVGLQNHGDRVSFRNIRILEIR
ncbi:MAG: DUF1080 domain-containing protein [Planctomycetota bacterium]|nr:DUF1080 domain-containing protein [Planctomycetota bacterium]